MALLELAKRDGHHNSHMGKLHSDMLLYSNVENVYIYLVAV